MFKVISKASRLFVFYPVFSILPIPLAYRLASFFSPMERSFTKKYMDQWRRGLERCMNLGGAFKVDNVAGCVRQHLKMLSMETLDSYMVPRLKPEQMTRLSQIEGLEHIKSANAKGRGLIIVTSHFCRLNMTAYTLGKFGIRNGILSQSVDNDNPYLDSLDRRFLTLKLRKYYKITGGPGLTLRDNPRKILRALERNEIMVILMDAYPDEVRNFFHVPFLGGVLKLPKGIARISKRTGSPLVYSVVKPIDRWKVNIEIRPLLGIGEEAFYQAVNELERDVKELPCQWWQWAYMHSMWRKRVN